MSDSASATPDAAVPAGPEGQRPTAVWAALIVVAVAALALFVWHAQQIHALRRGLAHLQERQATAPTPPPGLDATLAELQSAVGVLDQRVGGLQQRVDAAPPAAVMAVLPQLHALRLQVDALEQRPAAAPKSGATSGVTADEVAKLAARVAALEQKPAPSAPAAPPAVDLGPLQARIAKLEQLAATPPPKVDLGPLQQQVAALSARLDAVQTAVAAAAKQAAAAEAAAQTAGRAIQWQRAALALREGKPLGTLPDAPAAVQKFATAAPPTEAQLRLSFDPAAAAALQASRPTAAGGSFGQRALRRVESLVTVREGDRVLVGAPASATLQDARKKLDAGDLAGAVRALDGLDPAAAAAMADWRGQAQALLDARDAVTRAGARAGAGAG